MREIQVGCKRSIKLEKLTDAELAKVKIKLGKDSKAKDFPYSAPKRPFLVPGTFHELMNYDVRNLEHDPRNPEKFPFITGDNPRNQPLGDMGVFELAMKQIQVMANLVRNTELEQKVCDPSKNGDDVIDVEV